MEATLRRLRNRGAADIAHPSQAGTENHPTPAALRGRRVIIRWSSGARLAMGSDACYGRWELHIKRNRRILFQGSGVDKCSSEKASQVKSSPGSMASRATEAPREQPSAAADARNPRNPVETSGVSWAAVQDADVGTHKKESKTAGTAAETGGSCEPLTPPKTVGSKRHHSPMMAVKARIPPSGAGEAELSAPEIPQAPADRASGDGRNFPDGVTWSALYTRLLQAMQRTREFEVQLSLAKSDLMRLQTEWLQAVWTRRHAASLELVTGVSETGVSWEVPARTSVPAGAGPAQLFSTTGMHANASIGTIPDTRTASHGVWLTIPDAPAVPLQSAAPTSSLTRTLPCGSNLQSDSIDSSSCLYQGSEAKPGVHACNCSTASSRTFGEHDTPSASESEKFYPQHPTANAHSTEQISLPPAASTTPKTSGSNQSRRRRCRRRHRQSSPVPGTSRYWTEAEHKLFLEALKIYGHRNLKAISAHVGTRNPTQVRTHVQKYFMRLTREALRLEDTRRTSVQPSMQSATSATSSRGDGASAPFGSTEQLPAPGIELRCSGACAQPHAFMPCEPAQAPASAASTSYTEETPSDYRARNQEHGSSVPGEIEEHPRETRRQPFNSVPDTCGVHLLSLVAQENML